MPTLEEFERLPWFQRRPQAVKDLIRKFPYASTVKIKASGELGYVLSWFEDKTLKILIPEENGNGIARNLASGLYVVIRYRADEFEFICENPKLEFDDDVK